MSPVHLVLTPATHACWRFVTSPRSEGRCLPRRLAPYARRVVRLPKGEGAVERHPALWPSRPLVQGDAVLLDAGRSSNQRAGCAAPVSRLTVYRSGVQEKVTVHVSSPHGAIEKSEQPRHFQLAQPCPAALPCPAEQPTQQGTTNMEHAVATSGTYSNFNALQGTVRLVTPEMAERWLARNTINRPLRKPYVLELCRELQEGRWKVTHQGVALTPDELLLDGQHRLNAILKTGISAPLMVTEGVNRDAWGAIDQGKGRTGGQILAMSGVTKDAPRIVAMARAILQVVHGINKVSNTAAAEYAVAHQTELELFLPVARQYTPAVGAAFAWCATLGWGETIAAADRLLSTLWADPAELDPMRALHTRARNFSDLGAGQAGITARFNIALGCLEAVHEERGLQKARSYRPDYGKLERESLRPRGEGRSSDPQKSIRAPRQGKLPVVFDPEQMASHVLAYAKTQERLEEERTEFTNDNIPKTSMAYVSDAERDAGVDAVVEAELVKQRKSRKSAEG